MFFRSKTELKSKWMAGFLPWELKLQHLHASGVHEKWKTGRFKPATMFWSFFSLSARALWGGAEN